MVVSGGLFTTNCITRDGTARLDLDGTIDEKHFGRRFPPQWSPEVSG